MKGYKKDCSRKEDLITYLYGECTPKEEKEFKLHLQECSSCKEESTEFGMLRQNLQAWNMQETPRVILDLANERPKVRSLKEILQELFSILPTWFKFGTGLATACAGILLMLSIFNTQIRYDQSGFSFQVALFGSKTQSLNTDTSTTDEVTRALVAKVLSEKEAELNQALEAKRSQIETELKKQIDVLSGELSEKSNSQLSKASLELKRQHRAELEKALNQLQRQRNQDMTTFEDDPFNLWGGVNEKVLQKAFENGYGSYPSGN